MLRLWQDYVVLGSLRLPSEFSPSFLIALRSIEFPEFPIEAGVVRNETRSSGFIIYPISERLTKVTFINQMSSSTASHYATDIVGASKKLQQSFINIREKVSYDPRVEQLEKDKKAEEPHYSDVECKQS